MAIYAIAPSQNFQQAGVSQDARLSVRVYVSEVIATISRAVIDARCRALSIDTTYKRFLRRCFDAALHDGAGPCIGFSPPKLHRYRNIRALFASGFATLYSALTVLQRLSRAALDHAYLRCYTLMALLAFDARHFDVLLRRRQDLLRHYFRHDDSVRLLTQTIGLSFI